MLFGLWLFLCEGEREGEREREREREGVVFSFFLSLSWYFLAVTHSNWQCRAVKSKYF
jgi:hypothetical protein